MPRRLVFGYNDEKRKNEILANIYEYNKKIDNNIIVENIIEVKDLPPPKLNLSIETATDDEIEYLWYYNSYINALKRNKYYVLCSSSYNRSISAVEWFRKHCNMVYNIDFTDYNDIWTANEYYFLDEVDIMKNFIINNAATIIQKNIRRFLAKQLFLKLKYKPGGDWFNKTETRWYNNVHKL